MLRNIIAIAFVSIYGAIQAQTGKLDSFQAALRRTPVDNDTAHIRKRAILMMYVADEYALAHNFDACRTTSRQLLALSNQLNYLTGQRNALYSIGYCYGQQSRYLEAIDTFLLCYKVVERTRDTVYMCRIASMIASTYDEMQHATPQAIQYARLCIDLSRRANRKHGLCACQAMLSDFYATAGLLDSAEINTKNTLILAEQIGDNYIFPNLYLNLAHIERLRKNYASERDWLLRIEKIYAEEEVYNTTQKHVNCWVALMHNAINRKDLATARHYHKKIDALLPKAEKISDISQYYSDLSQLAEMENRPADALRYYKMHIEARDSVNNMEKTRRVTQIQMNFEFERKQAVQAAAQERELAIRDARNQQQRTAFGFTMFGLIGAAAFGFYAYRQKQERRRSELELASLRAQINPHFIFNCLNSIYRYTRERDTDTASKYLQKFSSLLRLVLENSRSEKITLTRDLEALQLYADIEGLRFKEKLHFSIDMDQDIDPTFIEIPGMLIQPHVENAIWHGLMHRPTGGNIVVRLRQPQENLLRVEIEDNGIGRAAAAELASKSAIQQKSLGQKITAERLKATGKLANTETIDLFDSEGNAAGTRVILDIPL